MKDYFSIYKKIILGFWIFIIAIIFFSSLKSQVVLGEKLKMQINTLFPEGWSFFTRDPQEPLLEAYKIENNKLLDIPLSNSSKENLFGFSRKSRVQGFEASIIISDVPSKLWIEDTGNNYEKHISDRAFSIRLKKSNNYFKKGLYLFVLKKPIPWAWANKNQEKFTPYSSIKVNLN
ncbi:SdpA family antimicrobial peptide system protein [Chryseobacterium rhizosphaerae]|uniref:SdpA family antimicrobial peptide system protein n=1 Tax=Chryseobacterium rhizosphaerae TaxID=395937 RepID=UPI0023597896|nr:SdpA family antimicrobial peptide system protein [Chryseobacterium rhizosphaerae]MDC8101450.1 SdpA family antimicrobial peptide system protein [Chryseobacterium rhizosphaerae]